MMRIRLQDIYIKSLLRLRIIALHRVHGRSSNADLDTMHLRTDVGERMRLATGSSDAPDFSSNAEVMAARREGAARSSREWF